MQRNEDLKNLNAPRVAYSVIEEAQSFPPEEKVAMVIQRLAHYGVFYPKVEGGQAVPLGAWHREEILGHKIPRVTVIHPGADESPFVRESTSSHYELKLNNTSEVGPKSVTIGMSYGFTRVEAGWVPQGESIVMSHHSLPFGHGAREFLDVMPIKADGSRVLFADNTTIRELIVCAGFVVPMELHGETHHVGGVVILE